MDHDVESSTELNLMNSLEYVITAKSSRSDDADSKLDECAGWTNEKHNAYLDYLENSFVKHFIGGESQRQRLFRASSDVVQSNSLKTTDQFTILQNGFWKKVRFGKKQAHLETSSEIRFLKSNPKCSIGTHVQGNLLCNEETKHSGDDKACSGNSVGHECLAQSTAEASGQNFIEEEKRFDSEVTRKREREASNDSSSLKDQVVPVRTVKPRM